MKEIKLKGKIKGFAGDFLYGMMGPVSLNGIIQLVLYPFFNRELGAEHFGVVLTLLSVVSIMASTFGSAANYSRMVSRTKGQDFNGDYNLFLLLIAGGALPVSLISFCFLEKGDALYFFGYYLLMIISILRYYADVEFRLNLNYKRFFLYYLLISIGYVAGVLVYPAVKSWTVVMLVGETLAVGYVVFRGQIFSVPLFQKSSHFKENMKSVVLLSGTNLISSLVLNADRLILQAFSGGATVTVFYAATLIGKIVALVSMPLNGVIIGHLARYKGKLPSSVFLRICLASLGLGVFMDGVCVGISHIFVRVMYPDVFELAKPYFWLANAGQVFYFISGTLTVILLRFTDEKYQLYINLAYLALFLTMIVPMTALWGLWGMALALLTVNVTRIVVIMVVGKAQLVKKM